MDDAGVTSPLPELPARPTPRTSMPRYAVVLKTYTWDSFVHRQAQRCYARASGGDFYLAVDQTRRNFGPLPYAAVACTDAELASMGFADRFGERSLLWWNPDYAHYHFHEQMPGYDYYVFVEYDATYSGAYQDIVCSLADRGVDVALLPLREPLSSWCWTEPHLATYPAAELDGALLCISVFSSRALALLAQRRRQMRDEPTVTYWPSAEVFVPTESRRAGLHIASLESFGDTSCFNWSPPHPEKWVGARPSPAFAHPVYPRGRYRGWALAQGSTLSMLVTADGPVRPLLRRLPWPMWVLPWLWACLRALPASLRQRSGTLRAKH